MNISRKAGETWKAYAQRLEGVIEALLRPEEGEDDGLGELDLQDVAEDQFDRMWRGED